MPERRRVPMRATALMLFAVLSLILVPSAAQAHKLKVFASVDGTGIRGLVFFGREAPAKGVSVTVTAPDGTVLANTTTDAEGHFNVQPARRIDHRIVANGGDGHAAEYLITAAELPPHLPGGETGVPPVVPPRPSAGTGGTLSPAPAASVPIPAGGDAAGGDTAAVATLVEDAVARQVGPLREQLAQFEEQVLLRDILGGLGYIVGVTGIALWLRARATGRP